MNEMRYSMGNDLVRRIARKILTKNQRDLVKQNLGIKNANEEPIYHGATLSVIVPMYNVQDYLKEALESVLKQKFTSEEIRVILIDDGSDDDTLKIAQQYVEKGPEIFELHQVINYGAGKIRNLGIQLSNSEYITFLDADDVIEDGAYGSALDHINKTGSDILLGRVRRFNTKKSWLSEIHSKIPTTDISDGITINDQPNLVYYTTAWDKIYNLDFLKQNNILFSEGEIYEDLIFTNSAYTNAKSIDITDIPFYKWRSRDNGQKSDTQRTDDIQPLLDRYNSILETFLRLQSDNVTEINLENYVAKAFNFDIPVMFKRLHHIDLLSDADKTLVYEATLKVLRSLNFEENYNLTSMETLPVLDAIYNAPSKNDFLIAAKKYVRQEISFSGKWVDDKWMLKSDLSNLTKIATSKDFKVITKVQKVIFDNQQLIIQGFVFAKYSDMSKLKFIQDASIALFDSKNKLIDGDVGNVQFFVNKNITARYGYNTNHFIKNGADFNYDYSGYKIEIPVQKLIVDSEYLTVQLNFRVNNQILSTMISNPIPGNSVRPKTKIMKNLNVAFDIRYNRADWNLQIIPTSNLSLLSFENSKFIISNSLKKVYLQRENVKLPLMRFGKYVFISPKVDKYLSEHENNTNNVWKFMTSDNSVTKPVYFTQELVDLSKNKNCTFLLKNNGQAILDINWHCNRIVNVEVNTDTLFIEFELLGWEQIPKQVVVRSDPKTPEISWTTEKDSEQHYHLTLPLTLNGFGKKEWLNFQVVLKFMDGHEEVSYLKWGNKSFDIEGTKISSNNVSWEFRRIMRNGGAFAIKRTADRVYREEIGSLARFLETQYSKYLEEPLLDDTVVWSAYWGRENNFNGNPRALYDYVSKNYSKLKHVIVVKDVIHSFDNFSENTKVISFGTKEYWYYLARAKYFVNDVNFTQNERKKREKQIEIQTMHGTPLKTMGFDVLDEWTDASYNKMHKRFKSYDYLVVPSDWVAKYAMKAFNVSPKLLKTGYPRNDIFFKEHCEVALNNIKHRLGLPLEKKVVLYTPTYRIKNEKVSLKQRFENLDSLYQTLGNDKVLVIKNHNFDIYKKVPSKYRDKIFLMDPYEEITDLYMISDVLITDYSSVMFDYSLLNKPMIFWAFDYEFYVENRGINFDLRNEAPGPFVQKQHELEKWILDFEKIPKVYSQNIEKFILKFGQFDKGHASQQIAENIWGFLKG